jgi:restriction system protein
MPTIGRAGDALSQYVEPINSRRFRMEADLPPSTRARLMQLQRQYGPLGFVVAMFATSRFLQELTDEPMDVPMEFDGIKSLLGRALHGTVVFKAKDLRGVMDELLAIIRNATQEFNSLFGHNIFA